LRQLLCSPRPNNFKAQHLSGIRSDGFWVLGNERFSLFACVHLVEL
ncbi:Hypothetical protein EIN_212720, partial [Entamoeba invadens IP1]